MVNLMGQSSNNIIIVLAINPMKLGFITMGCQRLKEFATRMSTSAKDSYNYLTTVNNIS